MKINNKKILVLILSLSAILRFYSLDKVPPELFGDELDVGNQAYFLLNTGKDLYGNTMPVYLHSFSEWRAPLAIYATIPTILLFGKNEWGVRASTAFLGVMGILLFYLVIKNFPRSNKKNDELYDKIALLSSLFLAISQWHIQYSRAAFEVSLNLVLIFSGILLVFKYINEKKDYYLYISTLLFALTLYTYNTAYLFTPLIIFLLILYFYRSVEKNKIKKVIVWFAIFLLPVAYNIVFGNAAERFSTKVNILADQEIQEQIVLKRIAAGNTFIERIFHNTPLLAVRRVVGNYSSAFSPEFLFKNGDITFRHSIHEIGQLFWIQLPLIIAGLYFAVKNKNLQGGFWIFVLLLAPIASSITEDGAYHATRLIYMLPPLMFFSAYGFLTIASVVSKNKRILFAGFVSIILVFEFVLYLHRYWVHYPIESWRWWQTGYKESIVFMESISSDYEIIAFNNTYEPILPRFLFWWNYSPDEFLLEFETDKHQEEIIDGFDGFELNDRYFFGKIQEGKFEDFIKPNILYLTSHRDDVGGDWDWEVNPPSYINVLKTVRNPYGEPIFYVVTGNEG